MALDSCETGVRKCKQVVVDQCTTIEHDLNPYPKNGPKSALVSMNKSPMSFALALRWLCDQRCKTKYLQPAPEGIIVV